MTEKRHDPLMRQFCDEIADGMRDHRIAAAEAFERMDARGVPTRVQWRIVNSCE